MEEILAHFERIVMPGITHWQHPRFFAYCPANAAPPSMIAEMLVSTIAPAVHALATGASNEMIIELVNRVNNDGRIYITQTRVDGRIAIRFQVGQFDATALDIDTAHDVLTELVVTA